MAGSGIPDRFLVAFSLAGEQRDLVRSIALAVADEIGREHVFLDEWFEHYIAGDDADLKLQRIYGERCALAVVCVSERYGGKPWTLAEHAAIRARQMQARASSSESGQLAILPIRVGEGEVEGILFNAIVPDVRDRSPQQAARLILDRLRLVAPDPPPGAAVAEGPGWPAAAPQLQWSAADHAAVRAACATLFTRDAPWRLLSICGPSESGKSHIVRQLIASTLRLPGLAFGHFDFKGATDLDAAVRDFVPYLDVPEPPASPRLGERLGHVLDALRKRARPALLLMDTYEAAGAEAQEWVERQLLVSVVREPWLRVVVAGQKVPRHAGAVWEASAAPPLVLHPPQPADWYDYGRRHRPELTLEQVEVACQLAPGRAGLLSQLLGPPA